MSSSTALGLASAVAASLWLGIIVLLHFTKPELDPKSRMVSEYALPPRGWVMRLAFVSLAVGCWTLAGLAASFLPALGPVLLGICGFGALGAGAFVTDPILLTEQAQTRSGGLHTLCSLLVMLLFPIMATIVGFSLNARTPPPHAWLWVLTVLPWAGLVSFAGATINHARHPATPIGALERLLILTFTAWLIGMACNLMR
jgi:hypothetical protein